MRWRLVENWKLREHDLLYIEEDVREYLEQIDDYMDAVLDEDFGTVDHVNFFISEMLPRFITALMKRP